MWWNLGLCTEYNSMSFIVQSVVYCMNKPSSYFISPGRTLIQKEMLSALMIKNRYFLFQKKKTTTLFVIFFKVGLFCWDQSGLNCPQLFDKLLRLTLSAHPSSSPSILLQYYYTWSFVRLGLRFFSCFTYWVKFSRGQLNHCNLRFNSLESLEVFINLMGSHLRLWCSWLN